MMQMMRIIRYNVLMKSSEICWTPILRQRVYVCTQMIKNGWRPTSRLKLEQDKKLLLKETNMNIGNFVLKLLI